MSFSRALSAAVIGGIAAIAATQVPASGEAGPEPWRDCDDCPEMITIPAGTFVMGWDGGEEGRYEGPPHEVTVERAFALGRFEVTHGQFAQFIAATGHQPEPGCKVYPQQPDVPDEKFGWQDPGYGRAPAEDEPVACVSWLDAKAYVNWLAEKTGAPYRLPTEAEWEYAARGGATTAFYWGDDADEGCGYANMYDQSGLSNGFKWAAAACDSGFAKVSPVGALKPNAFGLHDMLGNVWEWLEDCYVVPYPEGAVTQDAVQPAEGAACDRRSVRGGSWITRPDRNTVTWRGRDPENTYFSMFGFRVARDLEQHQAQEK